LCDARQVCSPLRNIAAGSMGKRSKFGCECDFLRFVPNGKQTK